MPIGTRHSEAGRLRHDGAMFGLDRDDGGRWRMLLPRSAEQWLGQRVWIEGVRVGFDELDVERITPLQE